MAQAYVELLGSDPLGSDPSLFYFHRIAFELEDVEVAPRDVHGDVVDGGRTDRALEAAPVRVTVEDDVRPVLRDRRREAIAAEVRPDPLRLAVQRVGGR